MQPALTSFDLNTSLGSENNAYPSVVTFVREPLLHVVCGMALGSQHTSVCLIQWSTSSNITDRISPRPWTTSAISCTIVVLMGHCPPHARHCTNCYLSGRRSIYLDRDF